MTVEEAKEIVDLYTKMWPFSRLENKEIMKLEQAYKVLKQHAMDELGEGRF